MLADLKPHCAKTRKYKKPASFGKAGSVGLRILLVGWLRESVPVAFFNAPHGPEQMAIRACPKLLMLAVKVLHHQRIENADRFQCRHIAMDASERCVETVEKIVDEGFLYAAGVFWCADKICVFFCVTDFGKRFNEKEAKFEETNFVKQVVKIVKPIFHASPTSGESVGHVPPSRTVIEPEEASACGGCRLRCAPLN
ncbi:MAG TPA: hypothetical protein VFQ41_05685 [Candidatus Angelobacter sp.]|nr:hypothetical protein [Candidatus Angelobacter sp.]